MASNNKVNYSRRPLEKNKKNFPSDASIAFYLLFPSETIKEGGKKRAKIDLCFCVCIKCDIHIFPFSNGTNFPSLLLQDFSRRRLARIKHLATWVRARKTAIK